MEKLTIKEFQDKSNIEIIEELMKKNNGYITLFNTSTIIVANIISTMIILYFFFGNFIFGLEYIFSILYCSWNI